MVLTEDEAVDLGRSNSSPTAWGKISFDAGVATCSCFRFARHPAITGRGVSPWPPELAAAHGAAAGFRLLPTAGAKQGLMGSCRQLISPFTSRKMEQLIENKRLIFRDRGQELGLFGKRFLLLLFPCCPPCRKREAQGPCSGSIVPAGNEFPPNWTP